ncbi:MAG TPA: PIN domain-containing protein [Bryobacteraceae bacterium]|nr:PIN domain-containing protein [Bryobacteraceae bacterium]
MPDRAFIDTNVLVYAFSASGRKTEIAESLLLGGGIVGVQTLNEFVNVAVRKLKCDWPEILAWLRIIERLCPPPVPITAEVHLRGLEIAQVYRYPFYDSLMLAAALEDACDVFCSEDMQHGQVIDTMTIRNPFRE